MSDLNLTEMHLASDVRRELNRQNITGPAADLVLRYTAPARHEWRVLQSAEAALKAAAATGPEVDRIPAVLSAITRGCRPGAVEQSAELVAKAVVVLALDANGIGGPRGLGGGIAAARHPAFARPAFGAGPCGKGRRQASDGGAWMAAALDAGSRLLDLLGRAVWVVPRRGPLVTEFGIEVPLSLDWPLAPREWRLTAAKRGLLFVLGLLPEYMPLVGAAGEPADWSALINTLVELTAP